MWGRKEETTTPTASSPPAPQEKVAPGTTAAAAPASALAVSAYASATDTSGRAGGQIGKSLSLKGEITGQEDLYIDGEVEGKITLEGHRLTVGPNGTVRAEVTAAFVTVLGRLQGNVRAADRIEIRKTGSLEGDLITARIVIEEDAMFRGSIDIVKPGQQRPAHDAPPRTGSSGEAALKAKAAGAKAGSSSASP